MACMEHRTKCWSVPAKTFSKLFCYFWLLRKENSEKTDSKKQKEVQFMKNDLYFFRFFLKNLVMSKLHSTCSYEPFERKFYRKLCSWCSQNRQISRKRCLLTRRMIFLSQCSLRRKLIKIFSTKWKLTHSQWWTVLFFYYNFMNTLT